MTAGKAPLSKYKVVRVLSTNTQFSLLQEAAVVSVFLGLTASSGNRAYLIEWDVSSRSSTLDVTIQTVVKAWACLFPG